MDPLVFEPFLRPLVWGGRRLGDLLGKNLPGEGSFGESWEISAHRLHVSRVIEGPLSGTNLDALCREAPREIYGDSPLEDATFPLLIKLLDCHGLLSIQVHPGDEQARRQAGERFGKCESWVVLHAEPGSRVYAGLRPGVSRTEVECRLADGTLEHVLHTWHPKPGDCIFLPAGTVHAVGGGLVLAEIQQASDATFRLYDWNRPGLDGRPRELHVQQALEAIDWTAPPVRPVVPDLIPNATPGVREERLVDCPKFQLDRLFIEKPSTLASGGQLSIWLVVEGTAALTTPSGYRRVFRRGETVLIPAATRTFAWQPVDSGRGATLLRVRLPNPDMCTGR